MVTGKFPFEFSDDGNLLALYEKIISAKFEIPNNLNSDLVDLIQGI